MVEKKVGCIPFHRAQVSIFSHNLIRMEANSDNVSSEYYSNNERTMTNASNPELEAPMNEEVVDENLYENTYKATQNYSGRRANSPATQAILDIECGKGALLQKLKNTRPRNANPRNAKIWNTSTKATQEECSKYEAYRAGTAKEMPDVSWLLEQVEWARAATLAEERAKTPTSSSRRNRRRRNRSRRTRRNRKQTRK